MKSAWAELTGYFSPTKVKMLITLVAILCNGQLCLEKVVTNSEQSGITMTACQANAQIGIADWFANGPYHEWKLEGYKISGWTYFTARPIERSFWIASRMSGFHLRVVT